MDINRLLQIETSDFDKIEMIISNNLDLMYKGKACVTIDNWDKLTNEILLWHESKVKNLALSGVSKSVTTKELKCQKCKKHGVMKYVNKSECTYCGNVC